MRGQGFKARPTHLAALLKSGASVLVADVDDEYGRLRVSEAIHKTVALDASISLVDHKGLLEQGLTVEHSHGHVDSAIPGLRAVFRAQEWLKMPSPAEPQTPRRLR